MIDESVKSQSKPIIYEVQALNYNPPRISQYYEKRSHTYNQDTHNRQYRGPQYIVDYLASLPHRDASQSGHHDLAVDIGDRTVEILDAGCGTGLVGIALRKKGYRHIDGFDLCEAMVAKARQTGAYRSLIGGCNMLQRIPAYSDNEYIITLCCGVFTTGLVPPIALMELIRVTKPGGVVLVSTRKSYYETQDFKETYEKLAQAGAIELIDCVMDGPYLAEEGAHYWAFKVL